MAWPQLAMIARGQQPSNVQLDVLQPASSGSILHAIAVSKSSPEAHSRMLYLEFTHIPVNAQPPAAESKRPATVIASGDHYKWRRKC
jgi:hypothetical protein